MSNPFPGLRPFQLEESHLFFGREEQTGQLLERLSNTRFLAVVGASGSGKSSLVRAGLLPQLYGGTMVKTSVNWDISIMRPGGDPTTNLARSLVESDIFEDNSEDQVQLLRTMLSRSGLGLLEAYRRSDIEPGTNLLILVDQFEEIFRFRQSGSKASEEAADFIELILEASWQEELPIYVILTMRSDFLGDCAEFKSLAEAVNEGEYLIPRLNRRQRALAIEGPAKVGGGEMSPRLVQQLLNDIGDDPDQLPILQHSLMRTWEYWEQHNEAKDKPLDVEHYRAIGTMKEALSRHADVAHNELPDDHHRKICERMFKSITERGNDGRGIRRPLPFSDLVEIVGGDEQALMKVIDDFRTTNRSFIMPLEHTQVHIGTVIDISHESLMRVWERLRGWVDEESQSARIYRRLAETSALHDSGEAGLYHDPDLRIAITWREEHHPNERWASRYSGDFHAAIKFLEDSQAQKEADEKAKEEARKRELEQAKALAKAEKERADIQRKSAKRNKIFAVFLFALSVLAGVMAYQANTAKKLAKNALSAAKMSEAELYVDDNEPGQAIAMLAREYKNNSEYSALLKRNLTIADSQPLPSYNGTIVKDPNNLILTDGRGGMFNNDRTNVATLHKKKGESGLRVYDLTTKQLMFESEKFKGCESMEFSPDEKLISVTVEKLDGQHCVVIYDMQSGQKLKELNTNNKLTHSDISNDLKLITAGSDKGEIIIWESPDYARKILKNTGADIWEARINPAKNQIAAVSFKDKTTYELYVFDLSSREVTEKRLYSSPKDQMRWWAECHYSKSGEYLILLGGSEQEGSIVVYNAATGKQLWIDEASHSQTVFDCDISPDETLLATASLDMTARIWDIETGEQFIQPLQNNTGLWVCRFNQDQTKLITIDYSSRITVWGIHNGLVLQNSTVQESPILMVAPTSDTNEILVALQNGKVLSWNIKQKNRHPILFTHNRQIINSLLLPGDRLVTSGQDAKVKVWSLKNLGEHKVLPVEEDVWDFGFSKTSNKLFGITAPSWMTASGVTIWNWPDLTVHKVHDLPAESSRVAIHPDGELIAYSNKQDFSIELYDLNKQEIVKRFEDHGDFVTKLEFSPGGDKLITTCFDETARIYNIENLESSPLTIEYGFSYGGNVSFSPDNRYFLLRTTIGADASTAQLYLTETGEKIGVFEHASPVRDSFFKEDGNRLYTCSRSGEVKVWDIREEVKLIMAVKQKYPVGGVLSYPNDSNKLITIDRQTDIRVWDINLKKVIDGPFRGKSGADYWFIKLHSSKFMNGVIGNYGSQALAYWANPLSLTNPSISNDLLPFTSGYIGGEMDDSSTFKISDYESNDLSNTMESYSPEDSTLKKWKTWFLGSKSDQYNSHQSSLSKENYVNFLKKQKTKQSLEAALLINPKNTELLRLYGEELSQRSKSSGINSQLKATLQKRANWYLERARSLK